MFSCSYCPLVTNFHVTSAGLGKEGATPVIQSNISGFLSQNKNLTLFLGFLFVLLLKSAKDFKGSHVLSFMP